MLQKPLAGILRTNEVGSVPGQDLSQLRMHCRSLPLFESTISNFHMSPRAENLYLHPIRASSRFVHKYLHRIINGVVRGLVALSIIRPKVIEQEF